MLVRPEIATLSPLLKNVRVDRLKEERVMRFRRAHHKNKPWHVRQAAPMFGLAIVVQFLPRWAAPSAPWSWVERRLRRCVLGGDAKP